MDSVTVDVVTPAPPSNAASDAGQLPAAAASSDGGQLPAAPPEAFADHGGDADNGAEAHGVKRQCVDDPAGSDAENGPETDGVKRLRVDDPDEPPQNPDFPESGSGSHADAAAPRTPTALDTRLDILGRQIRSLQDDFRQWQGIWRNQLRLLDSSSRQNAANIQFLITEILELRRMLTP